LGGSNSSCVDLRPIALPLCRQSMNTMFPHFVYEVILSTWGNTSSILIHGDTPVWTWLWMSFPASSAIRLWQIFSDIWLHWCAKFLPNSPLTSQQILL
jgi:hypothetical protein